jgi:putative membrane protein
MVDLIPSAERKLRAGPLWLFAICIAIWVFAAIKPLDFEAWLLEQFATVLVAVYVVWYWPRVVFSRSALIGLAALFCFHTLGTHWTYSLTPYDALVEALTGVSINETLGWERNNYDRFVHYMWGLCLALPIKEALEQSHGLRSGSANALSLHVILATSAVYELIEWAAALLFGGDLGAHYLGTQGDPWDAQADIALGGLGWITFYVFHKPRQVIAILKGDLSSPN